MPIGRHGPDLTGQKLGMLSVIGKSTEKRRGRSLWKCLCECGRIHHVVGHALTSGNTVSCGCKKTRYPSRKTHGQSDTRLHNIWMAMCRRCSPSCPINSKQFYYDKGIKVCNEWQHFEPFRDWALDNGYDNSLSIDRRDGDKDYSPGNCRWATAAEQNNNSSHNRMLTLGQDTKTLERWAKTIGITPSGLHNRLARGWPIETALTAQLGTRGKPL